MLIFIENTPRSYAWGSRDALPHMLGTAETGEPQAELWLGAHPSSPATIAKAPGTQHTLIDLIESDPERYGVDGGMLPFLLKVLAIGAPLSLQVHPDADQAAAGFAAEEAAGIPLDAPQRNYRDPHHKPELLVALSDVSALCGFRPLSEVRHDVRELAAASPEGAARQALQTVEERLRGRDDEAVRRGFLDWALTHHVNGAGRDVAAAVRAITGVARAHADSASEGAEAVARAATAWLDPGTATTLGKEVGAVRLWSLRNLAAAHPGDPGILVSLLLHLVTLAPGDAIFLGARQLHAYLGGIGVEIMASSDNVLRAGLTQKHVDSEELCRIVDTSTLEDPHFRPSYPAPGVTLWRPRVSEFQLMRARLFDPDQDDFAPVHSAESVTISASAPIVLIATEGRVRVERQDARPAEVAIARRGQSLYISAGEPVTLSGRGEVFLATVGNAQESWESK